MIEEAYVTFETAKLLKEKGFRVCPTSYIREDGDIFPTPLVKHKEIYPAPTQQMAMKWLREKHNIFIEVRVYQYTFEGEYRYEFDIFHHGSRMVIPEGFDKKLYSYEEEVETAIKYCLTNLI